MELWGWFAVAVVSSFSIRLTILAARKYQVGIDPFLKTQGVHFGRTARLGGIGIFVSFVLACVAVSLFEHPAYRVELVVFCLVTTPVFLIGLAEDFTLRVSAALRLLITAGSAAVGMVALGAIVHRINVPFVDQWLASATLVCAGFTLVAVAGVPHALNIIDGCNGLAASTGLCGLLAIGAVAAGFHDGLLLTLALAAASAVTGFLVWNFPYGRIFLGDGGSYWLGFTLAELSVMLVSRHPQVSSWFPMLLAVYPVWETLFSCVRRLRTGGIAAVARPDVRHLHHLVYRRLMLPRFGGGLRQRLFANSATTLPFLLWSVTAATLGGLLADRSAALFAGCAVFALVYLLVYRRLAAHRPRRMPAVVLRRGLQPLAAAYHSERSHGDIGSLAGGPAPLLMPGLLAEAQVERAVTIATEA